MLYIQAKRKKKMKNSFWYFCAKQWIKIIIIICFNNGFQTAGREVQVYYTKESIRDVKSITANTKKKNATLKLVNPRRKHFSVSFWIYFNFFVDLCLILYFVVEIQIAYFHTVGPLLLKSILSLSLLSLLLHHTSSIRSVGVWMSEKIA